MAGAVCPQRDTAILTEARPDCTDVSVNQFNQTKQISKKHLSVRQQFLLLVGGAWSKAAR